MPNPYDVLNSSSSSSDEASKDDTFPEDAGSAMTSLTEANLGVWAPTNGSRRRDEDQASMASTSTRVSCHHSRHAARRVQERKQRGFDSLAAGKVRERGEFADRRLQAELHGSEGQGRKI